MDSSQCGKSIQLDLLSFAYTLANRAPEPLEYPSLPRVEHLLAECGPACPEAGASPHTLLRAAQWPILGGSSLVYLAVRPLELVPPLV